MENLDDAGGALGGQNTTYQYTGNGQIIRAEYAEPDLTYSIPGGVTGGYSGLDRFGRIKQLQWEDGSADRVVGFEYGYDRRSNRLFEKDTYLGTVGSKPLKVDALLQYDGLDRVVDFQRGMLNLTNDSISSANLLQDWTLDQTGNWKGFNEQVPSVRDLNQTRTHNDVNEISGIAENAGQIVWADPTHDANGNMTVIPKPSDLTAAYTATWDAWNRLVELTDNGEVVAAYQYDGTNRRVVVADNATVAGIDAGFLETDIEFFPEQWNGATGGPFPPGEFDATGSYFTTESETVNIGNINYGIAVDDNATGSGFMMYSVEDLHSRFGTSSSSNPTGVNANNADHLVAVRLNGTQWQYNSNYTWNNFNPVAGDRLLAEVDFSANTVSNRGWRRVYYSLSAQALEERLGSQVHQQYVWGLRFVDDLILRDRGSVDDGILDERLYAMHDLRFSIVAVANTSGVVQERYTYDAYGIRTVMNELFVEQTDTTVDWQFTYTGRRLDSATGLYFFRARYYSAELGRFVGRDPLGFVDGMNLYRGYFVPENVDPRGLVISSKCNISSFIKSHTNEFKTSEYNTWNIDTGERKRFYYETWWMEVEKNSGLTVEILSSMMRVDEVFELKGTTKQQNIAALKEHINTRKKIISNAMSKQVGFGPRDTEAEVGLHDSDPQKTWENLNVPSIRLRCNNVTNLLFEAATGILGVEKRERPVQSVFIPGDFAYIRNVNFSQGFSGGYEGENMIYVGNDLFWGHINNKARDAARRGENVAAYQTVLTLKGWFGDIRAWPNQSGNAPGLPVPRGFVEFPPNGLE